MIRKDLEEFQEILKKEIPSGYLILSGDWGGQIYLTVPLKEVKNPSNILGLLRKMDEFAWSCNEGEGREGYLVVLDSSDSLCIGGRNGRWKANP